MEIVGDQFDLGEDVGELVERGVVVIGGDGDRVKSMARSSVVLKNSLNSSRLE